MTSFAVQTVAGPVISSFVSKEKGSMGNRMDCAGSQIKNNVVTGLQAGVVMGAGMGAQELVNKSPKAAEIVANQAEKVASFISKDVKKALSLFKKGKAVAAPAAETISKTADTAVKRCRININSEAFTKLKELANKMKAQKAISFVGLALLALVGAKGIYQSGQIDQKYTDKATLQKAV